MIYDATLSRGDHKSSIVSLEIIESIIRSYVRVSTGGVPVVVLDYIVPNICSFPIETTGTFQLKSTFFKRKST